MICTVGKGRPELLINVPMVASSVSDLAASAGGMSAVQMNTAKANVEPSSPLARTEER